MKTCEVVLEWQPQMRQCGEEAVAYYPAMGTPPFMYLCAQHAEKHTHPEEVAKAINLRHVATNEPYGWAS